jgi:hypothetical protein
VATRWQAHQLSSAADGGLRSCHQATAVANDVEQQLLMLVLPKHTCCTVAAAPAGLLRLAAAAAAAAAGVRLAACCSPSTIWRQTWMMLRQQAQQHT